LLYAATLDLNAYQLARKDQLKLAREEWKKALQFDPENQPLVQNSAIVNLLLDDYDTATKEFPTPSRTLVRDGDAKPARLWTFSTTRQ